MRRSKFLTDVVHQLRRYEVLGEGLVIVLLRGTESRDASPSFHRGHAWAARATWRPFSLPDRTDYLVGPRRQ